MCAKVDMNIVIYFYIMNNKEKMLVNFQNYVKSENFRHVFHDVLGEGIFNTDGESWKLQRKTSSQIFHVKNFQTAFTR